MRLVVLTIDQLGVMVVHLIGAVVDVVAFLTHHLKMVRLMALEGAVLVGLVHPITVVLV